MISQHLLSSKSDDFRLVSHHHQMNKKEMLSFVILTSFWTLIFGCNFLKDTLHYKWQDLCFCHYDLRETSRVIKKVTFDDFPNPKTGFWVGCLWSKMTQFCLSQHCKTNSFWLFITDKYLLENCFREGKLCLCANKVVFGAKK